MPPSFPIPSADADSLAAAITAQTGVTTTGTDVKNKFDPHNTADMVTELEALAAYVRAHP